MISCDAGFYFETPLNVYSFICVCDVTLDCIYTSSAFAMDFYIHIRMTNIRHISISLLSDWVARGRDYHYILLYFLKHILAKLQKHKIHFHVASVSYVYRYCRCVYLIYNIETIFICCMIRSRVLDDATWRPTFANFRKIGCVLNSNIYR